GNPLPGARDAQPRRDVRDLQSATRHAQQVNDDDTGQDQQQPCTRWKQKFHYCSSRDQFFRNSAFADGISPFSSSRFKRSLFAFLTRMAASLLGSSMAFSRSFL